MTGFSPAGLGESKEEPTVRPCGEVLMQEGSEEILEEAPEEETFEEGRFVKGQQRVVKPDKEEWTPGTMHIHDLNATILHLLGIDHKRLTYRYQGRDFRLTDVHGKVVTPILA